MRKLPEGVDSTFRYILIASKRAEQLVGGARPRIVSRHAKPATIALAELSEGKVPWRALAPEEYEMLREQELQGGAAEEEAAAVFALPRPILPPVEPEPEEEEAEDFADEEDDLDDADFDGEVGDDEAEEAAGESEIDESAEGGDEEEPGA